MPSAKAWPWSAAPPRSFAFCEKYPDGRLDILCQGAKRFEIENLDNSRSFLQAEVDFFGDEGLPASPRDARGVHGAAF